MDKRPSPPPSSVAARAAGSRRHRRPLRQRRRGLAQADRLQERPGAVHDVRARAAPRWRRRTTTSRRRFADHYVGLSGIGGHQGARPAEAARRHDRFGLAVHRRLRRTGSPARAAPAEPRDGAAAALPELHRARRRPRGVRADASGSSRPPSPTAVAIRAQAFGEKLGEVNTTGHYTAEPLTAEQHRPARPRRDDGVLQGALRQRRRLHVLHGGRVQAGGSDCRCSRSYVGSLPSTGQATSRFKDVGITLPGRHREGRRSRRAREPRAQTLLSFFADPLVRPENEQTRVDRGDRRCSRSRCATSCGKISARPTASRSGCSRRCRSAATATSRCSFGASPENIGDDDRPGAGRSAAPPAGGAVRRPDEPGQGIGAARIRDGAEAERLLAGTAAVRAPARPRSPPDSSRASSASTP